MSKRQVDDQSGFCRHSKLHHLCRGQWETPSALVTCSCECHIERVQRPKRIKKVRVEAVDIVPKRIKKKSLRAGD